MADNILKFNQLLNLYMPLIMSCLVAAFFLAKTKGNRLWTVFKCFYDLYRQQGLGYLGILILILNVEKTGVAVTDITVYLLLVETLSLFLLVRLYALYFTIKKLTKRLYKIDSIENTA